MDANRLFRTLQFRDGDAVVLAVEYINEKATPDAPAFDDVWALLHGWFPPHTA